MNANTKKRLPLLALFFSASFFTDVTKPVSAEVTIRYEREQSDNERYDRRYRDNDEREYYHHRRHQNEQRNIPRSYYRSVTPQVPGVRSRLLLIDKNRSRNSTKQQRYIEQKFYRQRRIDNYYREQQNRFPYTDNDRHQHNRSYYSHD